MSLADAWTGMESEVRLDSGEWKTSAEMLPLSSDVAIVLQVQLILRDISAIDSTSRAFLAEWTIGIGSQPIVVDSIYTEDLHRSLTNNPP